MVQVAWYIGAHTHHGTMELSFSKERALDLLTYPALGFFSRQSQKLS